MDKDTLDTVFKLVSVGVTVAAAWYGYRAKKTAQELRISVDGRLSQLLALTAANSRAEGRDSMRTIDLQDAGPDSGRVVETGGTTDAD